jgi:hypothetical protein
VGKLWGNWGKYVGMIGYQKCHPWNIAWSRKVLPVEAPETVKIFIPGRRRRRITISSRGTCFDDVGYVKLTIYTAAVDPE